MWLAWGSASSVGELATGIHKAIVHKASEDCIISITEPGIFLSILLAMEVEALVTLRYSFANLAACTQLDDPSAHFCAVCPSGWCAQWQQEAPDVIVEQSLRRGPLGECCLPLHQPAA